MPEDRTPIDHGLAHPQPERGQIPQPRPQADADQRELVPNQPTLDPEIKRERERERRQPGAGGHADFLQTPD